jgi:hypothetical protein
MKRDLTGSLSFYGSFENFKTANHRRRPTKQSRLVRLTVHWLARELVLK